MPRWTQANLDAYEARRSTQSPKPKPTVQDEPLAKVEGKAENAIRIQVRIVSFRRKLCDPDNLVPKYFVDCLRYAGIIPDDNPQVITLEVSQVRVETKQQERTEIEILWPDENRPS